MLAVALLGAPAAFAVTGREEPVPAVAPGDKPIVTVEGNAVVDSSGKTTGYFELALKVKTGEKPAAGAAGPENRFYSASVALRYNATVLQPVSWDYMPGIENPAFDATLPEDPNSNPKTITVGTDYTETVKTATVQNPLAIETKKDDTIAVAEAKIAGYVASDPAAVAQNEKYDTAQITLTAQAPAGGKVYQEDTILCVVRFKYDKDEYPMLEGNTFQFMDGTVGAATNYVKVPNAAQRPGDGSGFDATAVWMANDVEASFTSAGQMAWYEGFVNGEETALYYYVGAPAMSANTRPAGTVGAGIAMPKTKGKAVFSMTGATYSYTENLLTAKSCHASDLAAEPANSDTPAAGDLVFVLVNAESYAKEGSDPDKMCAVLFYDWDDTLIGTLVVQKDQDARQAVNKYVKDHLIHPELTGEGVDITSMARKDNYRGKYPNEPAAEGVLNPKGDEYVKTAEGYPLSNKLDYVFLKRPMEHDGEAPKVEEYTDNEKYQAALKAWEAKWVQTSKENDTDPNVKDAAWDTELPYIYGWAEVADPAHPEEVWTTLGVGELDFYNQESSTFGRYIEIGNNPARLTVQDQEFTFANFDFSANTQDDTAYAVKAVYEPGLDLPNSTTPYRLAREPYYSKLSAGAAASGGAYEIVSAFERAGTVADLNNNLYGVPRAREPAVRQDTTMDYRWIKNEDLDVENNIPNVLDYDAYTGKGETTYTLVPVDNVDYISFSLSLSARQNKVDYYLVDAYGSSFVAGQRRAISDAPTRSQGTPTVDNYNYYTTESDTLDAYYDATYANRDGSRGFVLFGTLNNLIEKASYLELGLIEEDEFNQYITLEALQDANVRDADGYFYEGIQIVNARQVLRDAATAAKVAGKWNNERNCAQLTYHELQNFIINGSLDDGGTISWCHYHQICADTQSGKPGDWNELIAMATNGSEKDLTNIALLTPPEIEQMTHLRRTDGGTWDSADFAKKLAAAVQAGNTTWDTLQFALDTGAPTGVDPTTYSKAHYWWYDGAISVTFNSWADLGAAVKAAVVNSTEGMQDGSLVGAREAKLRQLEKAFDLAFPTDGSSSVTYQWKNVIHNLKPGEEQPFANFDAFVTAVEDAYTALVGAGNTYEAITWAQVQHYLINRDPTITQAAAQVVADAEYWWYDFGIKITTLGDLLNVAATCTANDMSPLDQFTYTMLTTNDEFMFAAHFGGTGFTEADMGALREKLYNMVTEYGRTDMEWPDVQYYILHGYGTPNQIRNEKAYYWWEKGGKPQPITISTEEDLIRAAFAELYNGNTDALKQLTLASQMDALRLVKTNVTDAPTFADLGHFADDEIANVKSSLKTLVGAALGAGEHYAPPTLNWYQIQHYLTTSAYQADQKSPDLSTSIYWWKDMNDNPNLSSETPLDILLNRMAIYIQSGVDADSRNADILINADAANGWPGLTNTDDSLNFANENDKLSFRASKAAARYAKATVKSGLQKRIIEISNLAASNSLYYADGKVNLTWYQIQYYIINYKTIKTITDADTAKTAVDEYIDSITKTTLLPWLPTWLSETRSILGSDINVQPQEVELAPEQQAIADLTLQISDVTWEMSQDPANALGYMAELNQLITQLNELMGQTPPAAEVVPPVEEVEPPIETTDPPAEETEPPTETTDPPVEETDPTEGETDPTVEETNPTETETKPPVEDTEPPAEETDPTEEETNPPATETDQPDNEANPPTEETNQPDTEETGEPDLVMAIPSYYTQLTFRAPSLMTLPPTVPCDSWLIYFTNSWRYRP